MKDKKKHSEPLSELVYQLEQAAITLRDITEAKARGRLWQPNDGPYLRLQVEELELSLFPLENDNVTYMRRMLRGLIRELLHAVYMLEDEAALQQIAVKEQEDVEQGR